MGQEREPLGAAKHERFGTALRAALRAEFGSSRAFAQALGVSEGRVSQIIGGPEDINTQTLAKVLSGFSSGALIERVHAAWMHEFAPLPDVFTESVEPDWLFREIDRLWQSGNPKRGLVIAEQQRLVAKDPHVWQELSERIALISLRLNRPGKALAVLGDMEERARRDDDRVNLLTALWMRGSALRSVEGISPRQLEEAHRRAVELASSWQPRGEGRERWQVKQMELHRDFALHALTIAERSSRAQEALVHGLRSAEQAVKMHDEGAAICLGLEVRARLEVASGQLFKAEETLDEAETLGKGGVHELWEKVRLTRARILLARGENDGAAREFRVIADECFAAANLHHFRVADQLLARLMAQ